MVSDERQLQIIVCRRTECMDYLHLDIRNILRRRPWLTIMRCTCSNSSTLTRQTIETDLQKPSHGPHRCQKPHACPVGIPGSQPECLVVGKPGTHWLVLRSGDPIGRCVCGRDHGDCGCPADV